MSKRGGKWHKLRRLGHAKTYKSKSLTRVKLTLTMEEAAMFTEKCEGMYICIVCNHIHLTNHLKVA